MLPADAEQRLNEACGGEWRYVRLALAELGLGYVDDVPDFDFFVGRVLALAEEDIIYDWEKNA